MPVNLPFKSLPITLHHLARKVSDVIIRAKKWRKRALATKETEEGSEVHNNIKRCRCLMCIYCPCIAIMQMDTKEVRPELYARRRAMTEVYQPYSS